MQPRRMLSAGVIAVVCNMGILGAQSSPAGAVARASLPRTPAGTPDFQGVTWNFATMTPLARPAGIEGPVMTEVEAATYERQTSDRLTANTNNGFDWWDSGFAKLEERRSSLIVDPPNGQLPTLTPEAQRRASVPPTTTIDDPESLPLLVRCVQFQNGATPLLPAAYNNNVQFIQTRDYIVISTENIHDARIVPMDGRPHGVAPQLMGDSRGRWEGDTLVVDTIRFATPYSLRGSDENLHILERFTRVDRDHLDYEFTADDPTVWTRPWTARLAMRRTDEMMFEFACHEGNFSTLANMLHFARSSDRNAGLNP